MAESGNGYSWIIALVIVFFMFVLPILKKVFEAVAGKEGGQAPRAPGAPRQPVGEKRGPAQEMLNEVEDFFRRYRTGQEPEQKVPRRPRDSDFDTAYRRRKRRIEDGRRREEQKHRRPAAALREPEPGRLKPVVGEEPEGLVVIEEPFGTLGDLTTLEAEATPPDTREEPEDLSSVLGEMPEAARMIVYQEILSAPKSLRDVSGY